MGRSTKVRDWDTAGAFIGFAEPLPSGTSLVLRGDGVEQAARVVEVFESADPAVAGMQVKFTGAAESARAAPKPVAAAAASAPAPAVVTAEATPVETSDAPSSTASSPPSSTASSPPTSEQGDGESGQAEQGGQAGSGGKRRRRRR